MDTSTTSAESTETRNPPPRPPLVRPVNGRMIAGVAAGVANSLGLSRGLVRFGFIGLSFVGGLGLALYLAGWLLIRDETESEPIAQRLIDSVRTGPAWIGVALLALAAVIVLDNLTFLSGSFLWATVLVIVGVFLYRGDLAGSHAGPPTPPPAGSPPNFTEGGGPGGISGGTPPPLPPQPYMPPAPAVPPPPPQPPSILGRLTIGVGLLALGVMAILDNLTTLVDPEPRHYIALATVVLGAGLVIGAFMGRARWLILLGFFVIPPLLVSPAAEVDWENGFERVISPTELATLAPSYEAAVGQYVFDLTSADWEGQTVDLNVEMAAGRIQVLIPDDIGLTGTATVSIGEIEAPDGGRSGLGDVNRTFDVPGVAGTLNVDLEMGAGAIEIETRSFEDDGRLGDSSISPIDESDLVDVERPLGDLVLDLSRLDLSSDADLSIDLGAGNLEVLVPDSLNVDIDASSRAGTITIFGSTHGDFAAAAEVTRIESDGPVIALDLSVDTGNITVIERQS
ncbi:MAG: LiaF domain-containing protein [Acidimicrobiia bacterium]